MCKTDTNSSSVCSTATCSGSCASRLATAEELLAAVATLQAADAALQALPPDAQAALALLVENTELSLKLRLAKGARANQPATVFIRRLKRRADDGPISGEAITNRMMEICGCKGQYDCDCVSVENLARQELWYRHNAGHEDPDRFEARRRG